MFDVGQKVICVKKDGWVTPRSGERGPGPEFGEECTVDGVIPKGSLVNAHGQAKRSGEDGIGLCEWGGIKYAAYPAKWFRPKEPNIEALRSLITKIPAKQPEKV